MLAVIKNVVIVQIIASLGGDVKPSAAPSHADVRSHLSGSSAIQPLAGINGHRMRPLVGGGGGGG